MRHLSPDQLAAFAENGGMQEKLVFAHLAECAECRDVVYELSAAASPKAAGGLRLVLAAAALALLILTPVRQTPQPLRIPPAFRRVSFMRLAEAKPQPNQFVLRTASGERWISFATAKLASFE